MSKDMKELRQWKEVYERYSAEFSEMLRRKLITEQKLSDEIWDTVFAFTGDNRDSILNPHWFLLEDGTIKCTYIAMEWGYKRYWRNVIINPKNNDIYYEI